MKPRMIRILILLLMAGLCGCARFEKPHASADAEFQKLADEYISGYLAWRPQSGTALGLHEYDGKVTDLSRASISREFSRLKDFRARLKAVRPEQLSAAARWDWQLLWNANERELFGFEQLRSFESNPMVYAGALAVDIYIKRNFAPREQRLQSIQQILESAPETMRNAKANLSARLPAPHVEVAIDIADGSADFLEKDLTTAVADIATPAFNQAKDRAVRELRDYAAWLKAEKLPTATAAYALGTERYRQLLRCEMVERSPEQLLRLAREQLSKTQREFAETARQIDPSRAPIEVFKAIQKDHPTAANLVADTARDLEAIRQFLLDHQIVTLPSEVRAEVRETPQFMRATSFASMDSPGVLETKATEAFYYVTPVEPEWSEQQKEQWLTAFNYYTTDVVSIHEAYPGHYTQFLWLRASEISRVRKISTSYSYIEGWAHYAEQMMIEEGFGRGGSGENDRLRAAKYHLAQLDEALLRLCRMCVSLQMHCQGMTVDEATRFFQENCYYEEKPSRSEALRGAFDPEYLYYTLGKLEFLKLREDYRRQEGGGYSLHRFHDEALKQGAPPLRLLRERLLKNPSSWADVL